MTDKTLAKIVVSLALVEVVTTAVFLTELRTDPALALYAIIGLTLASAGRAIVFKRRHRLLAIPPVDTSATLLPRRAPLDRERLGVDPRPADDDESQTTTGSAE